MHWTVLANKPTFDVTNYTKHVNQLMQQLHAALLLQQCLEEKHSRNCAIFKLEELSCLIDKCNTDSANNPPFFKMRDIFRNARQCSCFGVNKNNEAKLVGNKLGTCEI